MLMLHACCKNSYREREITMLLPASDCSYGLCTLSNFRTPMVCVAAWRVLHASRLQKLLQCSLFRCEHVVNLTVNWLVWRWRWLYARRTKDVKTQTLKHSNGTGSSRGSCPRETGITVRGVTFGRGHGHQTGPAMLHMSSAHVA